MAKSKGKPSADFVLTFEDNDKVADLDNDANGEINPNFAFDLGDDQGIALDSNYWSYGGKDENAVDEEDQLDNIIRKHGGLKPREDAEPEEAEAGSESEDENEDNNSEEASSDESAASPENESDDDSDAMEEDQSEESAKEEAEEVATVSNDKSGFFEDASPSDQPDISYAEMQLSRPIKRGVAQLGYSKPTPIQRAVIPVALQGKDIVAGAVTGSGKTAAYLIPTLERLLYRSQKTAATRVVILTPTRELALQVRDVGAKLSSFVPNLSFGLAVGGLNLRIQEQELKLRPDVVVATPGRFIDHVRNSPSFTVDTVEVLILDEADRMLEEGFENELNEILSLIPSKRQTMLFSATMNSSIQKLVKLSLHRPVRIMIDPPKQVATGLVQEFVRLRKYEDSRPAVLLSLLRRVNSSQRIIVFVARKQTAHKLRISLGLAGIRVGELHGALSQEQRVAAVNAFKALTVPILLCTDLASRGLDIPKIELVINYELPQTYEVYMHRVGRTARAGRSGTAISLVGDAATERAVVRAAVSAASSTSSSAKKQTILGRNVDWQQVNELKTELDGFQQTVEEILKEEKAAKEFSQAERDIRKAENILEHQKEIKQRPKRTWFEDETAKKLAKRPNSNRQKKKLEDKNSNWAYSKTKVDRNIAKARGSKRLISKQGARGARKKMK